MTRNQVARDLETGEPAMFEVIMARYILDRFGAITVGRCLPAFTWQPVRSAQTHGRGRC